MEVVKQCAFHIGDESELYRGEEVIVRRKIDGREGEGLVKWTPVSSEELTSQANVDTSFKIWMTDEEIASCCSQLVGHHGTAGRQVSGQQNDQLPLSETTEEDDSFEEMESEVINLVMRAKKLIEKSAKAPNTLAEKGLISTIDILCAYAKLGPLAGSFRRCGALDLLMELLTSRVVHVRESASDMLRCLAGHDPACRSHVLFHMAQSSDDKVNTFENREILMQLFAETAQDNGKEKIPLSQVPSRYIYSLLRHYLHMTSSFSSASVCPSFSKNFKSFSSLFKVMSEMLLIFGWSDSSIKDVSDHASLKGVPIFTNSSPPTLIMAPPTSSQYKSISDFDSTREYGTYIKSILKPNMRVKATNNYNDEFISKGDLGTYKYTSQSCGVNYAFVLWDKTGKFCKVRCDSLEIFKENDSKENMTAVPMKPSTYALSLMSDRGTNRQDVLHNQWWEILSLIMENIHPVHYDIIIADIINTPGVKELDHLISMRPSYQQMAKVVSYIDVHCPHINTAVLTIKSNPSFLEHYKMLLPVRPVVKDNVVCKESCPYKDPYDDDTTPTPPIQDSMTSHFRNVIGSPKYKLMSTKDVIEKFIVLKSPKMAVQCLEKLNSLIENISSSTDRAECAMTGIFSLILRLMNVDRTSFRLQCIGLQSFHLLLGDDSLREEEGEEGEGRHYSFERSYGPRHLLLETERNRSSIIATIMSLKSSTSEDVHDLSIIKDATQTIINYYHTQMSNADKKLSLRSVKHGLSILLVLLKHGEQYNVVDMMKEWGVVDLIQLVQTSFPDFDDKDKLCSQFLLLLPSSSHNDDELEIVNDGEEKVREVITLVQWLRCYDGHHNFLPRLMKVLKMETSSSSHSNLSLFLIHHGILALHNIITSSNTSTSFIEGALSIIEYVASRGEEEACQVVLQGGLRAFIFLLSSTPPRPVVRGILKCLPHFIAHEETVVVMAAENMTHLLQNVQDKYSLPSEDVDIINVVSKAVKAKDVCDISSRYSCILWNIFTGTLGHVVNEIEEYRRDQQLPNVPLLNSLVNFLSSNGITFTSSNTNDCIDKLEVSSNDYTKNNLIDNGDTSFWESDGRANLHWIRLYLKRNVIIKKLSISVRESDLRYLPNDVSVHGGTNVDDIVELNTVNWHQNRWQDAYSFETNKSREILSNCKRHYPLIVIKLKKNQSNVHRDIRIRGITIEPSSWSFWPSFENSFINRTQLYYHIQSHTWAITHSSSDLLGVFDKLNRAVEHEQSFADHYLMTRPSRISLGLACKASLFTPFTAGLQDGGRWNEAFMALLKDYLDGCNVKSCTSWYQDMIGSMIATDRVITNLVRLDQIKIYSKIRKMCRLLVDCDVTKPVVNEDNEDMKTNGHIITDTLKALWSRIVYQEVSSYLSRANLSDPLIFIMNDILFMYDKLHQVTQELFGHHPQLLLALKNGYSKAYQNMNEVNSIKFCEIFSLIIDMLMDASNKDTRHLSDSQRESLVIHMSFPLQFIHNLDMSHIFEYFYTKHLSRRLLNRSTLSVVIETRVGCTFSLCFPNDTPLKMLLDVTNSEKLSEDFSRLYLIREIDHLLYRCDEEVSDELVELADKLDLYQKGTLNVIVMTHHHWPLYHRPLPHLPHPLAMFVEDYNKFYASSAIGHSVRAYERNRQLKWTLYGNGVLEYNKKYQLKASTRQMIVLLHFNDYEEVSHVMLQELTHLPPKELDEVIIELTCDGNNILQSTDVGSSKLNTLYRINESFTAKSQHSFEITLEKVHGKVPGRPCCNEIENDLSRVFERRCAIIDGAIVRLLKREKEIKSDIITSRIIKGCCVGHFDDTRISFGRFMATPRDVHSRISNLISKGFIERKPNHYHTLIYLPDPSQDTKVSHGHVVMKKLLLHHASLRDDEGIPFISPSLGAVTLLEGDIKLAIHKEIQELSDVMCLPYDQVESLHHQFSWNSDELLQDYFSDKDEVLKGCGLIPASSLLPSVSMTCLICLTSDATTNLHSLWCRHNCCHSCWYKYLQSWVSSCNINISCSCPVNGCAAKLTRKFFGNILESNSEILLEYDKLLVRSYVQCSSTLSWCRNPQGCDGILEKKDVYRNGACTKCSWSSCFYCTFMEGHEPCSCEDIAKWVELGGYYSGMDKDAQSKHLANVISKRCPGCNAQIEKNEGCLHMKCACGHHFCWKCMKPWQPTHTDYYSCTASESKVAQDIKKFTLYDQKCGAFHKSVSSSDKLLQCVTNITEPAVPIKMLSFLIDACQLLKESFKMLAYSCVAEYFCDGNSFEYLRSVSSALGQNVSALQEFLETVMTTSHDVINLSSNLSDHKLQEGSKLLSKIRVAKEKLLLDNIQNYELGEGVASSVDWTVDNEDVQASRPINDLLSSNVLINSLLYFNDGPIAVDDDDDYFDIDDDYHDYDDYDDYDYDDDYYCGSSYDS